MFGRGYRGVVGCLDCVVKDEPEIQLIPIFPAHCEISVTLFYLWSIWSCPLLFS